MISEAVLRNEAAKREVELGREQAQFVEIVATQPVRSAGRDLLRIQLQNRAGRDVIAVGLRITYLRGASSIRSDDSCSGQALIRPGGSAVFSCALFRVPGADSYRAEIRAVQFR